MSQFQAFSLHPQLLLLLPLFNHSFMLPQPLAHMYSLLTAQLHVCVQNYSNSLCDSGTERIREAAGRQGSQRLYKMDHHRFISHTHAVFKLTDAVTETAPRGYLQEQVVDNFRSGGSVRNHQTQKAGFSMKLKADELEELSLNSPEKGSSPFQSRVTLAHPEDPLCRNTGTSLTTLSRSKGSCQILCAQL